MLNLHIDKTILQMFVVNKKYCIRLPYSTFENYFFLFFFLPKLGRGENLYLLNWCQGVR